MLYMYLIIIVTLIWTICYQYGRIHTLRKNLNLKLDECKYRILDLELELDAQIAECERLLKSVSSEICNKELEYANLNTRINKLRLEKVRHLVYWDN